ncbi:Carboxy-cis,cis-muconate cyclase [Daldinia childiae]|uniref:Carboxy-cis,cis-muconate cyclase n=1 Tax=Daldinia childiae TaxID=326645 RepID=UPI001447ACFF|nr:Carboxy-cis,cis-muconate cyclase [Daldinia childiae]KAF3058312.1 Carboxy-cis,cis-muconate cyclase [Daldinia childiae]
MRFLQALFIAIGLIALAEAAKHHLIVGTFSTNFLYTVEYDDAAETLKLVKNTTTNAGSAWITLSHDKKNLYGTDWNADEASFVSYSLKDAESIKYEARVFGDPECRGKKSIFVAAYPKAPYSVYGNYLYGDAKCGMVMSVHDNGTLHAALQQYEYGDDSAVTGTSFSADSKYLYSADDGGNSIWVHAVTEKDGSLDFLSRVDMPVKGADPRHIFAHPKGQYVYTVWEGTSEVAQLMTSDLGKLYLLQQTYPLIKDGDKASDFWAHEVALSANNKYLWASNGASDSNHKGYISAISVNDEGLLGDQLFLTHTTSSGGSANAIAPSSFDDRIVATTDNSTGSVEIWKMNDDKSGVKVVAHLDIDDGGGCCANAVWYS